MPEGAAAYHALASPRPKFDKTVQDLGNRMHKTKTQCMTSYPNRQHFIGPHHPEVWGGEIYATVAEPSTDSGGGRPSNRSSHRFYNPGQQQIRYRMLI